ncbi:MAG TPA: hypothetical protein VF527_19415 [Pyrinomonadaceae bacterium]|jgi:hypothetical protein
MLTPESGGCNKEPDFAFDSLALILPAGLLTAKLAAPAALPTSRNESGQGKVILSTRAPEAQIQPTHSIFAGRSVKTLSSSCFQLAQVTRE